MSSNILVVDDSVTIREQVSEALQQAGFKTQQAVDGVEGVDKIKAGEIHCVVCDVNMPNKNGIELVEEVRQDDRFKALPIIMLTTEGARDLIAKAKAAGANGWIVKPFRPDLLVAAVKKLATSFG